MRYPRLDIKPTRRHRYILVSLVALCIASIGGAHAAGLSVTSQRLTVSQNATSVPCGAQVTISNNVFTPSTVTITPGCSVTWTSTVNTRHSSTSNAETGNTTDPWDSGVFNQSDSINPFTRTFNTAGTFNYFCSIHRNNMQGTITVTP